MIGTNRKIETLIAIEKSKKQRYFNRIMKELKMKNAIKHDIKTAAKIDYKHHYRLSGKTRVKLQLTVSANKQFDSN